MSLSTYSYREVANPRLMSQVCSTASHNSSHQECFTVIDGVRSLTDPEQGVLAGASHPSQCVRVAAAMYGPTHMVTQQCLFDASDLLTGLEWSHVSP